MIAGLMSLMAATDTVSDPVNLGNPTEFTVLELARTVIAKLQSPSRLRFFDLPLDDPKQRKPDITRAAEALGWAPQVMLADGLAQTIPHFAALSGRFAKTRMVAE